jgi:hypothetical protein
MTKKLQIIAFHEVSAPVRSLTTKFGGQPVWMDRAQWPRSSKAKIPMRFVCQIRLDPDIFGGAGNLMAYLFYTDGTDNEGQYICGGSRGDGESAVIVQPGGLAIPEAVPLSQGPSLYKWVPQIGSKSLVKRPVEYVVDLLAANDPDFATEGERYGWDTLSPGPGWDKAKRSNYAESVRGNKIGGTPSFLSNEEIPPDGPWQLLLQLECTPFEMNFGDAGTGFAWIDRGLQRGLFFSQSC